MHLLLTMSMASLSPVVCCNRRIAQSALHLASLPAMCGARARTFVISSEILTHGIPLILYSLMTLEKKFLRVTKSESDGGLLSLAGADAHMLSGLLFSVSSGIGPSPSSRFLLGELRTQKSLVKKVPTPIEHPMPAFLDAFESSMALSMLRPSEKTIFSASQQW